MRGSTIVTLGAVALAVTVIPNEVIASVTEQYGAQKINAEADNMINFLFGVPLKIAGVFSGAFGIFKSLVAHSATPLIAYGGIGLAANLVPKFIEGVFTASGMLINQF